MPAYANLEIRLDRRDAGGYSVELRFSQPRNDAEIRLITVANRGRQPRDLDITSYSEVCLNHRRADQAHPAFAKLFLETEYLKQYGALLCRRRPRAGNQKPIWAVHVSAADGLVRSNATPRSPMGISCTKGRTSRLKRLRSMPR